jgi:hypothetical protein
MKKFTALFLVFCLLILSGEMNSKNKQGAWILVNCEDGKQVELPPSASFPYGHWSKNLSK